LEGKVEERAQNNTTTNTIGKWGSQVEMQEDEGGDVTRGLAGWLAGGAVSGYEEGQGGWKANACIGELPR